MSRLHRFLVLVLGDYWVGFLYFALCAMAMGAVSWLVGNAAVGWGLITPLGPGVMDTTLIGCVAIIFLVMVVGLAAVVVSVSCQAWRWLAAKWREAGRPVEPSE